MKDVLMRIFHCSDWHLFSGLDFADWRLKRLLGWANWRLRRGRRHNFSLLDRFAELVRRERPDAVVVTGDLTQLGDSRSLARAEEFLAEIVRQGIDVLCVPGNHDRYVNQPRALSRVDSLYARFGLGRDGFAIHNLVPARPKPLAIGPVAPCQGGPALAKIGGKVAATAGAAVATGNGSGCGCGSGDGADSGRGEGIEGRLGGGQGGAGVDGGDDGDALGRSPVTISLIRQAAPSLWFSAAGRMPQGAWAGLKNLDFTGKTGLIAGHYPLLSADGKRYNLIRRVSGDLALLAEIERLKPKFYLCGHIHTPFATTLPGGCVQLCPGSLTMTGTYNELILTGNTLEWRLCNV